MSFKEIAAFDSENRLLLMLTTLLEAFPVAVRITDIPHALA